MPRADLHFYLDPVCPFAWMTSKWVRIVQSQRDYAVEWRTISLRMLNAHIDYDGSLPPEYEAGHLAGLRLLRVIHAARAEHGAEVVPGGSTRRWAGGSSRHRRSTNRSSMAWTSGNARVPRARARRGGAPG